MQLILFFRSSKKPGLRGVSQQYLQDQQERRCMRRMPSLDMVLAQQHSTHRLLLRCRAGGPCRRAVLTMPSRRVQNPAQRLNLLEVPRQHEYLGTWCKHVPGLPLRARARRRCSWFCLFTVRTRLFPALSAHRQLLAVPSQYNDSRHGHGRRCSLRVSSRFWLRLCHAHVRGVRGGVLQAGSWQHELQRVPCVFLESRRRDAPGKLHMSRGL